MAKDSILVGAANSNPYSGSTKPSGSIKSPEKAAGTKFKTVAYTATNREPKACSPSDPGMSYDPIKGKGK